jgi:hypothetical protein
MRITIETDDQATTATGSPSQQMSGAPGADQKQGSSSAAPADLAARAAALGALDGGPAPSGPQMGSSSIPARAFDRDTAGAPAAGPADQDAGAAPGGIEVVIQTAQENGGEEGDTEGDEEDA